MSNAGERFKKIRQELNFSQQEFGQHLGLSSQGISNIEKNKSFLTLEKLQLLKNFNINLNYLIYGDGEIFTNKLSCILNPTQDELTTRIEEVLKLKGLI